MARLNDRYVMQFVEPNQVVLVDNFLGEEEVVTLSYVKNGIDKYSYETVAKLVSDLTLQGDHTVVMFGDSAIPKELGPMAVFWLGYFWAAVVQ